MADLDDALKAMADAHPGYDKAEQYADGPIDEVFVSPRLRWIMRQSGINFQEILGDVVIDAVADALAIVAIVGSEQKVTDAVAEFDQQALMKLIRPQVNRLTLKFGDYYVFLWPRQDGTLKAIPLDPRCARLFYDEDDPMTPLYGVRRWVTRDKHVRVELLYNDRVESFVSLKADQTAKTSNQFGPYVVAGNDSNVAEHGFGRPPLFHFTTGLPGDYGQPEHAPFYATQDILLKLTLAHMAAVDYTAIPQRYAIMAEGYDSAEAEDQDDEVYRIDTIPDNLRRHVYESKSSLKAEPGSLWLQRGIKQFGQFEPADPAGFLDPAVHHLKIGATTTKTPLHYFDGIGGGNLPSGESLKVAMEPLIGKRGDRRDTLDHHWQTFYATVLAYQGLPDATVDIRWAPVEPTSEQATWTVAKAKQDAGVPVDVTLQEGGYSEETVDSWQREGALGLTQRIYLLQQVGDFLASCATAVTAGSMDREQVDAILQKVIGPLDAIDGADSDDPGAD